MVTTCCAKKMSPYPRKKRTDCRSIVALRHELPRLASVVEAEREAQEVRVELVAHVVLDREGLPSGEQPPPEHERAAHEPERHDRADPPRRARVVSWSPSSSSITNPMRTGTRIPATCEPIARTDETTSEARYGRRNPSRRTNVRRADRGRRRRLLLSRHVLVGYGSCWRRCRTFPRGATRARSRRSDTRSRAARGCSTFTRTRITTARSSRWPQRRRSSSKRLLAGHRARARARRPARPRRRPSAGRRGRRRSARPPRAFRHRRWPKAAALAVAERVGS